MTICLLNDSYRWLASRSGFSLLPNALTHNGCPTITISPKNGFLARAMGKFYSIWQGYPRRNQAEAASEWEFLLQMQLSQSPGHVLFLENHLQFLAPPKNGRNWIGTIHLPRKCWKPSDVDLLRRFRAITVLCEYMADQFADVVDAAQIRVLPYGVDTSFFTPPTAEDDKSIQTLIFVGAWLRNTAMLARLVPEIQRRFPRVRFDFVVPRHARGDHAISTLLEHPSVRWHSNLSDEELKILYQKATAMLLPMNDSGASTSVVEALACGLPIVTTDVGGIRSYGGGTIFPVVKNDDNYGFLDLIATYLTDHKFRSSVSQASRKFAETTLDWLVAAREYIKAYRSLGCL